MKGAIRFAALAALAAALPAAAPAYDWNGDWKMQGDVYKSLDFSVRTGIDRATRTFAKAVEDASRGRLSEQDRIAAYRAAAAEWRKVQVQSESGDFDERVLSYALFMQGCAKELARDSNEAVKLYSEVIELYPDILWVSLPAKLRLGCLQLAMGDGRKADATLASLLDDPGSRGTSARAIALRIVGDRQWNAGKFAEAEKSWWEVLSDDLKSSGSGRRAAARERLMSVAMAKGDFAELDRISMVDRQDTDAQRLSETRWLFDFAMQVLFYGHSWYMGYGDRVGKLYPSEADRRKKTDEARKAFFAWFAQKRALYESTGKITSHVLDSLRAAIASGSEQQLSAEFKRVEELIRAAKTPADAASIAGSAKDILCSAGKFDLARRMPEFVKDPLAASWMRYQIESSAGKFDAAVVHLDEYLSRKPSPDAERNAKYALAQICRDRLGKYDRAIALYQELNDPPRTLWDLHNAYRKAGRKAEGYQMLEELESIFPGEAARATWTHAQCLESDGKTKQAIALYRRLLSQPEWKKTQESSWAHQALERHGIATGGAVVNEVR